MLFSNKKKSLKTQNIDEIPGIERECANALKELGYESVSQLKSKDAEEMYYQLCALRGKIQEKELLYSFRCAVYYATVVKADPKKLHWWYWKDSTFDSELPENE